MQLHTLQPNTPIRRKKRIARGGKRGTYSGRGQKGQKSRSGHRIPHADHELLIRLPKFRGHKNKPIRGKTIAIDLLALEHITVQPITREALIAQGVIQKTETRKVKIVGISPLSKAIALKGIACSLSAKKEIERAGGSVL